ncbi:hypothetical protein EGN69_08700 [Pseudomonas monteilii]|nr:hypothetical protein EGN69_08700 [Pseudomonas monteilii]
MTMDEEEHVRDVYAHYGLAMYWSQCVEQSMFIHLMFLEFLPRNVKNFSDSARWASDFDSYEAIELGKTMGRLLQKLKSEGQPTEEVSVLLASALKKRNWLAHSYFSSRAVDFMHESGRSDMIEELREATEFFREAAAKLDAITMPIARRYGFTEDMEAKVRSDMFEEYQAKK